MKANADRAEAAGADEAKVVNRLHEGGVTPQARPVSEDSEPPDAEPAALARGNAGQRPGKGVANEKPARRLRWSGNLPKPPKGDAPWAKLRPELAELDEADHALLMQQTH